MRLQAASLERPRASVHVIEKRPIARGGIEGRAHLERGQMPDELGRCLAFVPAEGAEVGQEIGVRQRDGGGKDIVLHTTSVSWPFFRYGEALGSAWIARETAGEPLRHLCLESRWERRHGSPMPILKVALVQQCSAVSETEVQNLSVSKIKFRES